MNQYPPAGPQPPPHPNYPPAYPQQPSSQYQQPPQFYQQPPFTPPPQFTPPPRQQMRRRAWIVVLCVLGLFIIVALQHLNTSEQSNSSLPSATPATQQTRSSITATVPPKHTASPAKLTAAQKQQVAAILNGNIQHYQQLLAQGKSILGTTQYADGNAGLAAMNDPNSNARRFSAWRQSAKPETDVSYLDAFKKADAFYNADNEPDAISNWSNDMGNVQSDLTNWINVAVNWQISVKTTADLTDAENQFNQDIKQAQTDIAATLSAS